MTQEQQIISQIVLTLLVAWLLLLIVIAFLSMNKFLKTLNDCLKEAIEENKKKETPKPEDEIKEPYIWNLKFKNKYNE